MMTIAVDIDADAVLASLDRVVSRGDEPQRAELQALGSRYVRQLKAATPIGRGEPKPRRLVDAYNVQEAFSATGGEVHITNETPYLRYVLNGRGPVVARPGKMLRFVIDGRVFFRKRVGPAKANPFDQKVSAAMRNDISGAPARIAHGVVRLYTGGA
jgi:hypothetical protein